MTTLRGRSEAEQHPQFAAIKDSLELALHRRNLIVNRPSGVAGVVECRVEGFLDDVLNEVTLQVCQRVP